MRGMGKGCDERYLMKGKVMDEGRVKRWEDKKTNSGSANVMMEMDQK
jgi:hypothetical protein